jgi:hypothetical protein
MAPFDQLEAGKTLGVSALKSLAEGSHAGAGVCDILCAKWVRMMIKKKYGTPAERMHRLNSTETMRKAITRHVLEEQDRVQGFTRTSMPKTRGELLECLVRARFSLKRTQVRPVRMPIHTVCDGYGLKLKGKFEISTHDQAAKTAGGTPDVCAIILITSSKGRHALACRGAKSSIEFFDPNHGEYSVPAFSFKSWFFDLLDHYGAEKTVQVGQFEDKTTPRNQRAIQWQLNMNTSLVAMNLLRSRGSETLRASGAVPNLNHEDLKLLMDKFTHGQQWSLDETMEFLKMLTQPERDWWMRAMYLNQGERLTTDD